MKISDIVALAKAGYKYSEVKELIQLATETPEASEEVKESGSDETPEASEEAQESEPEETEDTIDYKALYEESQKALKAAQAANRKQPKDEPKSAEEIALEHFKEILH